jgi:hypothetical protein
MAAKKPLICSRPALLFLGIALRAPETRAAQDIKKYRRQQVRS